MKSATRLLAIVGSQRKNGNSYLLTRFVLKSAGTDYRIIQLAEKNIRYCNLCGQCVEDDCVLRDDFDSILKEMKKADGIVFAFPKYLFVGSKLLAFLERLDTVCHMRKHKGYEHSGLESGYKLFPDDKPFCVFALSGTGEIEEETLKIFADYVGFLGLRLVPSDKPPHSGVVIKAGDKKGDVLKNAEAIVQCRVLVDTLIGSVGKKL